MIIACDIDGVLADIRPYHHFLPKDWDSFFKSIPKFTRIKQTLEVVQLLIDNQNYIVFVTARPEKTRNSTLDWLSKSLKNLELDTNCELLMRKEGDRRENSLVKKDIYRDLDLDLIFEDEPDTIKELKEMFPNIPILQVHGFRITEKDLLLNAT